jgi:DNA-binding IclR family transcriptional regulator
MPKKAAQPALADQNAADGGIATLDRALSLLGAFSVSAPVLSLIELSEHTKLYKSTVLRMLASLMHAHLVHQLADGRYTLGPEVQRLAQVYSESFSLEAVVMPVLHALAHSTRESAAYYVRQGDRRVCLFRVPSPRPVRDYLKAGDVLPMDRGAGGRVLTAFSGGKGALYARIRREQVVLLAGDRVPELTAAAAPVFGPGGELAGAITLTMPTERRNDALMVPVLVAARQLTALLGGSFPKPG